jgi:hypothetical protein
MKKIRILNTKKTFAVLLIAVLGLVIFSCVDGDKDIFDDFEKGGFVRFKTPFPTVANISTLAEAPSISITTTLETPDSNVTSYSIEVSAVVGGEEYGPAAFGSAITSFPFDLTITMTNIAAALGFDIADVGFADTFSFTGTAVNDKGVVYVGNDRQTFSVEDGVKGGNNSSDLLDELGYRNAFEFAFAIPCPPNNNPISGNWVVEMADFFGDGWDGAFITVEIDGVTEDYTIPATEAATHNFTVPAGTGVLRISYTSGAWEEEHSYTITNPNGETFGPFGSTDGGGPGPGTCPVYTSGN